MAEQNPQDQAAEQGELTEAQREEIRSLIAEGVRDALTQAAGEASKTPGDRLREGYAAKAA